MLTVYRGFQGHSIVPLGAQPVLAAMLAMSMLVGPVWAASSGTKAVHQQSVHKSSVKSTHVVSAKAGSRPTVSYSTKANPNAFIAYYNQGRDAYRQEHYAEAEKLLKKSMLLVEQVPPRVSAGTWQKNIAIVSNMVGINAFKLKKYSESTAYLQRAMSIYSRPEFQATNQDSLMNDALVLGQIAMYEGRYEEARTIYQGVLPSLEAKLGPDNSQTKQAKEVLEDISQIDYGPDYLNRMGAKVIHWTHSEQPILVFIEDGSHIPGWKSENQSLVREAYAEWQRTMENRVHFEFVSTPQEADTIVSWMERPKAVTANEAEAKPKELRNGECETFLGSERISKDNITVALNSVAGVPASANGIYNTVLHEIEHSLGMLGGHSSNPADILFPNNRYDDGRRKHLTLRDIQSVRRLFSLKPDITNPAGIHLVRYHEYTTLLTQAKDAYSRKDYPQAAQVFRDALAIYSPEMETRFWLGASLYNMTAYSDAIPYLMASASMPGKYQDEALKFTGYALIKLGEIDDKSGNRFLAEQKYQRAYQVLNQGLQTTPTNPENRKAIQDELVWLNHRLSIPTGTVIQWAAKDNSNIAEKGSTASPRKQGWFSNFVSSFSSAAVPGQAPSQ